MNDKLAKFLHFFKRNEYKVNQNLRFISVVLAIVMLIGMFQPLAGVQFGVDLKTGDTGIEQISNKDIPIIPDNTSFFNMNLGDMVIHKQLRDYPIFDTTIGQFEILGINLYDFATTAFPDFSFVTNIDNALDAEWIQFFVSDDFAKICQNFLGEYAQGVIDVANTIVGISQTAGDALDKVIEVLNVLSSAKAQLVQGVHQLENTINVVDTVAAVLVLIFLVGVVLACFKKLPRYLGAGIMTPICVLFLAFGIAVLIANGMIGSIIDPIDQSFNDILRDFISTQLPDVTNLLGGFVDAQNINFELNFKIIAGLGWWIVTLCITACTVMAYVMGSRNKGKKGDSRE